MVARPRSGAPRPLPRRHTPVADASRGAAPYVIKLGGTALEGLDATRELAASLIELGAPTVIVHGGGRELSDWCRRLGHEPSFDAGLRVTDPATLEVAVAVLRGLANARLVAGLGAAGIGAVGLCAVDGGLVDVRAHPESARLGRVGVAAGSRVRLLEVLIAAGFTPVVSSIGARDGELLNLNADELAGALAAGLCARALVMLSDVEGLRLDGRLIRELPGADVASALAHPDVRDGMIPKLAAGARALAAGVSRVVIARWHGTGTLRRLLEGELPSTTLRPSDPELARA